MKLLSVNIRTEYEELTFLDQAVKTGINKCPVEGPVSVHTLGLAEDKIADKKHHGGVYKAVYSYAAEDYDFWRTELARPDIPYGSMGENLTTLGLDESQVHIGDQFQVGAVILEAAEPRQPCRVLGMNFEDMTLVKRFLTAGRMGIYFKVLQPGTLQAGDVISVLKKAESSVPISEITRLHKFDKGDQDGLERILKVEALPPEWRKIFEVQLAKINH
jgi:MOSC domain-containing protein YiiM